MNRRVKPFTMKALRRQRQKQTQRKGQRKEDELSAKAAIASFLPTLFFPSFDPHTKESLLVFLFGCIELWSNESTKIIGMFLCILIIDVLAEVIGLFLSAHGIDNTRKRTE